jgi:uncharacterized repeat protein (TIGR01451 family)
MKNLKTQLSAITLIVLLVVAGSAFAQRNSIAHALTTFLRPDVKISLTGTVTRENKSVEVEKAGNLNPGEVLNWTITSMNAGNAPAQNYKTIGEIPTGTAYVASSAKAEGNVNIVYSIDDGKIFDEKPMIDQKQPDGSTKKVAAPVSMYTQIRYEWNDPLSEGKQFSASYKVRVK